MVSVNDLRSHLDHYGFFLVRREIESVVFGLAPHNKFFHLHVALPLDVGACDLVYLQLSSLPLYCMDFIC